MKLYFRNSRKGFSTNLPEEMQVWLKDCIKHIGVKTLSYDVVSLLHIGLEMVNVKNKSQDFVNYKYNSYNGGADGAWCVSPFEAIINVLKGNMITIASTSDEAIGKYYRTNFPELYHKFIKTAYDCGYDDSSVEDFGCWLQDCEARGLVFSDDEDKAFDFDDCKSFSTLEQIKSELKDLL